MIKITNNVAVGVNHVFVPAITDLLTHSYGCKTSAQRTSGH